nr:PTS sugar transporter subunit IIB [Gracilibacillus phocaeensis]
MEGIVHVRVDDRLIHGQVATRWATGLRVNRIMIIDDIIAVNDDEKAVLRMAAPAGVNTSILPFEKAVANIKAGNYKGQRVLLVVKSPEILVRLQEEGLELPQVNVGNLSNRFDTIQIKKSVSLTKEEEQAIQTLMDSGITVTAQMVPEDPETSIEVFLKKAKR